MIVIKQREGVIVIKKREGEDVIVIKKREEEGRAEPREDAPVVEHGIGSMPSI